MGCNGLILACRGIGGEGVAIGGKLVCVGCLGLYEVIEGRGGVFGSVIIIPYICRHGNRHNWNIPTSKGRI